jgi:chitinase
MPRKLPARLALVAALGLMTSSVPIGSAAADSSKPPGPQVLERVGYFTQWGIYSGYFVKNIETSGSAARMTVINYAFGNVSEDGRCFEVNQAGQGDAWADYQRPASADESVDGVADTDDQRLAGNFNQLRKLKQRHPNLRVVLSLGGWTWSKYFSNAALPENRKQFVASCIDLFVKGDLPVLADSPGRGGPGSAAGVFDGFDLDWEWPGSEGNAGNVIRPEDKQNFTALVSEFRAQLDALKRQTHKDYVLTAFLPANPSKVTAGFDVKKIFKKMDFATVQGYDLHGSWELTTNHQSALFSPPGDPSAERFSDDLAVQTYLAQGAPARKLVLGVPFYSQGWTGVTNANDGLFQPATGGAPGTPAPYKIVKDLPGFTLHRDNENGVAWLFDGTTFWTFDDPVAISQKMEYVREHKLGGAMAWSLDSDDANGSLMRAIADGLGGR